MSPLILPGSRHGSGWPLPNASRVHPLTLRPRGCVSARRRRAIRQPVRADGRLRNRRLVCAHDCPSLTAAAGFDGGNTAGAGHTVQAENCWSGAGDKSVAITTCSSGLALSLPPTQPVQLPTQTAVPESNTPSLPHPRAGGVRPERHHVGCAVGLEHGIHLWPWPVLGRRQAFRIPMQCAPPSPATLPRLSLIDASSQGVRHILQRLHPALP